MGLLISVGLICTGSSEEGDEKEEQVHYRESKQQQLFITFYRQNKQKQPMGQQISKPTLTNAQMYLTKPQHQHQQDKINHRVPGHPRIVRSSASPVEVEEPDAWVERYDLEVSLTQQQAETQARLYSNRKKSLPWHVRVLGWHLDKTNCYCVTNKLRGVVYTEHVENRLVNFKVAKAVSHIHSQQETFESFSLNEGIYVLINALQGYRLLTQQFNVNYPTVYSIAVNKKAQVKVWMNQHWALNQQRAVPIPEHVLIEQIINLVVERTQNSTLQQLVSSKYFGMGYKFQSVLQALGQYTIEYGNGRKDLQERIRTRIRQKSNHQSRRKYSLNKTRASQSVEQRQSLPIVPQILVQSQLVQATSQVRYSMDESLLAQKRPHSYQIGTQVGKSPQTLKQSVIITTKALPIKFNTMPSSPIKAVKFTYQHSPQRPSSPRCSQTPTRGHTNSISYSGPSHPNLFDHPGKCSPLTKQSTQPKVYFSPQQRGKQESNSLRERDLIMRKLKIDPNGSIENNMYRRNNRLQAPVNLGMEAYIGSQLEQVEYPHTIRKQQDNNTPMSAFSEGNKTVQFMFQDGSLFHSSHSITNTPTVTPREESLIELTSQFRLLLQSDKKIDKSFENLSVSQYSDVLHSISNGESIECEEETEFFYQKSEEFLPKSVQNHIYAIKEVDQDVSYSVDQCK